MGQEKWTVVTTFILLDLSPAHEVQLILFFLFLLSTLSSSRATSSSSSLSGVTPTWAPPCTSCWPTWPSWTSATVLSHPPPPDAALVEILTFSNNGLVILLCFLLLLVSYSLLLLKLWAHSPRGQNKVASTCVTHIIVVFVMFVPAIYIYCRPFRTIPLEKVLAVLHTVVFPLTNPMIYTFRNKEVKLAMSRMVSRCGSWEREL
ncbi:unnamed protein product, partial [Natator depressus]